MRPLRASPRWETLLDEMVRASATLTQAAPAAFPHTAPGRGADPASIAAAAERLGRPLDAQHETLLRLVDGWQSAFQSGTLLGTHDLGQGALWTDANASLDVFYAEGDATGWPPRGELVPVHASPHDSDVMALWLGGPVTDGGHPVVSFSGEVVDTWPHLQQWWLRMLDLQELSLAHVLELTDQGPGERSSTRR